jgi:uracil-DNA glycosylase
MHVNQAQTALWTEMAADPGDGADRLTAWQPARWPVAPDWRLLVDGFFASPSAQELGAFVRSRLEAGAVVYPPRPLRAFELTPLFEVRVVILGQDPYHGAGQAQGLAFSVAEGQRQPPSLRNIFKELQRDLGMPLPASGSLLRWARQGVLLLNTCLTVEEGRPASHGRGARVAKGGRL